MVETAIAGVTCEMAIRQLRVFRSLEWHDGKCVPLTVDTRAVGGGERAVGAPSGHWTEEK